MYGANLFVYAQEAYDGALDEVGKNGFAVIAIIFVMALIEVFFSIMGVLASNERNSAYMQVQYVDLLFARVCE